MAVRLAAMRTGLDTQIVASFYVRSAELGVTNFYDATARSIVLGEPGGDARFLAIMSAVFRSAEETDRIPRESSSVVPLSSRIAWCALASHLPGYKSDPVDTYTGNEYAFENYFRFNGG